MFTDINIYLKIHNNEIVVAQDIQALEYLTGGSDFDKVITYKEWEDCLFSAYIENGSIILGCNADMCAKQIIDERNIRLAKSDWTQTIDVVSRGVISREEQLAWAEYRKKLYNIKNEQGFPWKGDSKLEEVPWPKAPDGSY